MRDFARLSLSIWNNDDFLDLGVDAQHLYFVLLSAPGLNYCGVADWRPGKLSGRVRDWTKARVLDAAAELRRGLFIVVDDETEEVLVRSFIRNDGVMKQRNLATAMARDYSDVASVTLKGVIVHELKRIYSAGDSLAGWRSEEALPLLQKRSIDPSVDPSIEGAIDPSIEGAVDPSIDPSIDPQISKIEGAVDPSIDPSAITVTITPNVNTQGVTIPAIGSSAGARATNAPSEIPPTWIADPRSARCARHLGNPSPPRCGACADARKAAEAARDAQASRARSEGKRRRAAIEACELCDEHGWVLDSNPALKCSHDPEAVAAARADVEQAKTERERAEAAARERYAKARGKRPAVIDHAEEVLSGGPF